MRHECIFVDDVSIKPSERKKKSLDMNEILMITPCYEIIVQFSIDIVNVLIELFNYVYLNVLKCQVFKV